MRSFVPNEKKSACSRDLVGADAGARELDHRPDEVLQLALLGRDRDGQLAQPAQLLAEADERMHDLDERRVARSARAPRSPRGRSRAPASRRSPGTSARAGSRASRASGSPRAAADPLAHARRPSPPRARAGTRAAAGRAAGSSPAVPPSPRRSPRSRPAGAAAAGRARPRRSSSFEAMIISLDDGQPVLGDEHVLGAAEADPLRAELARLRGVFGRVRVRAHLQAPQLVRPLEDRLEVLVDLRRDERRRRRGSPRPCRRRS